MYGMEHRTRDVSAFDLRERFPTFAQTVVSCRVQKNERSLLFAQERSGNTPQIRPVGKERTLAAQRKSLYEIVRVGNTIFSEKLSYQGWQKRCGSSSLSGSSRLHAFVCPVPALLGRCAGVPADSTRVTGRTRRGGAGLAAKLWHPRARTRLSTSQCEPTLEPIWLLRRGRLEAWKQRSEPAVLEPGEHLVNVPISTISTLQKGARLDLD